MQRADSLRQQISSGDLPPAETTQPPSAAPLRFAVNPDKADLVNDFIDWLISVPTQKLIGECGVKEFGSPLFTPDSVPWRESS